MSCVEKKPLYAVVARLCVLYMMPEITISKRKRHPHFSYEELEVLAEKVRVHKIDLVTW